jgi:hypothetical protein
MVSEYPLTSSCVSLKWLRNTTTTRFSSFTRSWLKHTLLGTLKKSCLSSSMQQSESLETNTMLFHPLTLQSLFSLDPSIDLRTPAFLDVRDRSRRTRLQLLFESFKREQEVNFEENQQNTGEAVLYGQASALFIKLLYFQGSWIIYSPYKYTPMWNCMD